MVLIADPLSSDLCLTQCVVSVSSVRLIAIGYLTWQIGRRSFPKSCLKGTTRGVLTRSGSLKLRLRLPPLMAFAAPIPGP